MSAKYTKIDIKIPARLRCHARWNACDHNSVCFPYASAKYLYPAPTRIHSWYCFFLLLCHTLYRCVWNKLIWYSVLSFYRELTVYNRFFLCVKALALAISHIHIWIICDLGFQWSGSIVFYSVSWILIFF